MQTTDSINRFVHLCTLPGAQQELLLILRSLATYSVYADQIAVLDPCAAILPTGTRLQGTALQLPAYADLAPIIPYLPQHVKERLCEGDYIELVGAYVLATLTGVLNK